MSGAPPVIIETRGSGQAQGPSSAFTTMVSTVRAKLAGGVEYDTVYPADWDQDSSAATADVSRAKYRARISVLTGGAPHRF
jgi:hypothetical protein